MVVNGDDIKVNLCAMPGSPDTADMMQPAVFKSGLEAEAAFSGSKEQGMQMGIFDGKGQDRHVGMGGTDTDQVEYHTIILVAGDELRRQFSVRAKVKIARLARVRVIHSHHNLISLHNHTSPT